MKIHLSLGNIIQHAAENTHAGRYPRYTSRPVFVDFPRQKLWEVENAIEKLGFSISRATIHRPNAFYVFDDGGKLPKFVEVE